MDVWIAVHESNAEKTLAVLRDFGMPREALAPTLFLQKDKNIRMGFPPVRIEIITGASGVDSAQCCSRRELIDIDGVIVNIISLDDLRTNKRAAGRHKDLDDLEHLP